VTPILGAVIADQYLGKYNTILVFAGVYWVGLLILWASALPASIAGGHALGGYVAAIIIIGFGTGGIKSNIGECRCHTQVRDFKNGLWRVETPSIRESPI
jgi:POT family proton-dependent oligopeptide transporter